MCDISVIVPVYNGEKYIEKCLESITNQTLKNIEIICVNDGSTDNTLSILEKYSTQDKRIKVISIENRGQGHARNIALNESNGEYISFVDADDWIEKETYEQLYNKAKSDDLDLVFFQMINYIDTSGKLVETDLYNHKCFEDNNITETSVFNYNDTQQFLFEIPVCPVSKIYKKDFLKFNRLEFPEGMLFEDNSFFYESYFKCKRAGFIKKHFYYRRRHDDSVTQTFDMRKYDIIKAVNDTLNVFIQNAQFSNYEYDVINHTFSMLVEWFNKSPLYLKHDFYIKIKKEFYGFNKLANNFNEWLNEKNSLIFNLMQKNEYYLDFLTDYKLNKTNYSIYSGKANYNPDSSEYKKYKRECMNKYKLSVVIPIYNNNTLIHRTLMSIENQTIGLDNIEVLLVDDASSDNTLEVINGYADKHDNFKSISIENGTGSPGTPRNIGLLESTSDYIIFIDHDDFFEINSLKKLYECISEKDYDFVYGTYASVDNGIPTKIIYPNEKHGAFKDIHENKRSIAFPPPSIWTKLFKREFLLNNNIKFPTILGEDAIFVSKALLCANGVEYLWDSLICYHCLDNNSYTNNISYKYLSEGFASEQYMYDFYNSYDEDYYKIRGEGILDFYLKQFYKSNLNKNELEKIFPAVYTFTSRINSLGLKPHVNEVNKNLFNLILEKDINSIMDLKKINRNKPTKKAKIKNLLKKFAIKIQK